MRGVTTVTRNLPALGHPSAQQRAAFKEAKAILGITEPLQFVPAQPGCGRAISFEGHPDFFCDYAIMGTSRQQAATDILSWIYLDSVDDRVHSGVDFLSRHFGRTVREVAG